MVTIIQGLADLRQGGGTGKTVIAVYNSLMPTAIDALTRELLKPPPHRESIANILTAGLITELHLDDDFPKMLC